MGGWAVLVACWAVKGGVGTTVVAASLGLALARERGGGVLVVDLAGDVPAVLGAPEPAGPGVADWVAAGPDVPAGGLGRLEVEVGGLAVLPRGSGPLDDRARGEVLAGLLGGDGRAVVVDCGRLAGAGDAVARALVAASTASLLVTRPCFLSLRRAVASPVVPSGVVVVEERGRALTVDDVEELVGVEVVALVPWEPGIARAVDAGLLPARFPRSLARALQGAA